MLLKNGREWAYAYWYGASFTIFLLELDISHVQYTGQNPKQLHLFRLVDAWK